MAGKIATQYNSMVLDTVSIVLSTIPGITVDIRAGDLENMNDITVEVTPQSEVISILEGAA